MCFSYYNSLVLIEFFSLVFDYFDLLFRRFIRMIFLGVNLMIVILVFVFFSGYLLDKI